jgi:hypothetical protein
MSVARNSTPAVVYRQPVNGHSRRIVLQLDKYSDFVAEGLSGGELIVLIYASEHF